MAIIAPVESANTISHFVSPFSHAAQGHSSHFPFPNDFGLYWHNVTSCHCIIYVLHCKLFIGFWHVCPQKHQTLRHHQLGLIGQLIFCGVKLKFSFLWANVQQPNWWFAFFLFPKCIMFVRRKAYSLPFFVPLLDFNRPQMVNYWPQTLCGCNRLHLLTFFFAWSACHFYQPRTYKTNSSMVLLTKTKAETAE
jgi:hypothetical protein